MNNTTVIYFLSITLIVYSIVFVIKNFLVCYRASDNGIKNVAVILLVAFTLILAIAAASDAWYIEGVADELKYGKSTNAEHIQYMERRIKEYTNESIMCTVLGYIMSIVAYFIYRNIRLEISMNLSKDKEHWDWSKIRR